MTAVGYCALNSAKVQNRTSGCRRPRSPFVCHTTVESVSVVVLPDVRPSRSRCTVRSTTIVVNSARPSRNIDELQGGRLRPMVPESPVTNVRHEPPVRALSGWAMARPMPTEVRRRGHGRQFDAADALDVRTRSFDQSGCEPRCVVGTRAQPAPGMVSTVTVRGERRHRCGERDDRQQCADANGRCGSLAMGGHPQILRGQGNCSRPPHRRSGGTYGHDGPGTDWRRAGTGEPPDGREGPAGGTGRRYRSNHTAPRP